MQLSVLSLNCENMSDLQLASGSATSAALTRRSELLAALIRSIDADVIGLVEATTTGERTQAWLDAFVGPGEYEVYQGESRGVLGLALSVKSGLGLTVASKSKQECVSLYPLGNFDADNDGIREVYTWANRVPHEVVLSGGGLAAPVTVIVIHAKSKGVFIPGDMWAFEQQSRATRMKLRAQGATVRARLDQLVDADGKGRVIALGDMNDSAEFDIYAAQLGGAFLDRVMGSIWDPMRIFTDPHHPLSEDVRWTIDFKDRVINPITESRYGMPTDMRSWIDHILVSPELRSAVVPDTAEIHHTQPAPAGPSNPPRNARGTDHHPPSVTLEL